MVGPLEPPRHNQVIPEGLGFWILPLPKMVNSSQLAVIETFCGGTPMAPPLEEFKISPHETAPRFDGKVVFTGDMAGNLMAWDLENKKPLEGFLKPK